MTPKQLHNANTHYCSMFGNPMSHETQDILREVSDVDELEEQREELSNGEFDAAEAILLGL